MPKHLEHDGSGTAKSRRVRLSIALLGAVLLVWCLETGLGHFLSFNPRAMSSEGKSAARCLSSAEARACHWTGWKTWEQLRADCPMITCMVNVSSGKRYALHRPGDDQKNVLALGVDVYDSMVGDLWLGVDGTPLHCVDMTRVPGLLEQWTRSTALPTTVRRDDDPRCATVGVVPTAASLRAAPTQDR